MDNGGFMVVGNRIKEERIRRKMSQQQLGDLLGVTKVSVCGYENGTRTPTMETFLRLIEVLETTPDYLLGRDINVICEEEEKYVKKISKDDLNLINEIKKYPKLYSKLCSQLNRTVELMDRRIK